MKNTSYLLISITFLALLLSSSSCNLLRFGPNCNKVKISSTPEGADVFVNGKLLNKKTPCEIRIKNSSHIYVVKNGFLNSEVFLEKHSRYEYLKPRAILDNFNPFHQFLFWPLRVIIWSTMFATTPLFLPLDLISGSTSFYTSFGVNDRNLISLKQRGIGRKKAVVRMECKLIEIGSVGKEIRDGLVLTKSDKQLIEHVDYNEEDKSLTFFLYKPYYSKIKGEYDNGGIYYPDNEEFKLINCTNDTIRIKLDQLKGDYFALNPQMYVTNTVTVGQRQQIDNIVIPPFEYAHGDIVLDELSYSFNAKYSDKDLDYCKPNNINNPLIRSTGGIITDTIQVVFYTDNLTDTVDLSVSCKLFSKEERNKLVTNYFKDFYEKEDAKRREERNKLATFQKIISPEYSDDYEESKTITPLSGDELLMIGNVNFMVCGKIHNPFDVDTTVKISCSDKTFLLGVYYQNKSSEPVYLKLKPNETKDFVCIIKKPYYLMVQTFLGRNESLETIESKTLSFEVDFVSTQSEVLYNEENNLVERAMNNTPFKCDRMIYHWMGGSLTLDEGRAFVAEIEEGVSNKMKYEMDFVNRNKNSIQNEIISEEVAYTEVNGTVYLITYKDGKKGKIKYIPSSNEWCTYSDLIFGWSDCYKSKGEALCWEKLSLDD